MRCRQIIRRATDLEREQNVEHAGDGEVAGCDLGGEGGFVAQELLKVLGLRWDHSLSSVDFISYRAPKPAQYGTVVVETVTEYTLLERKSQQTERKAVTFEEREAALESSKKIFLQAWNEYIEFLKTETEDNER